MTASQPATTWKKRILVPFWIVRILLMLLFIAAFAWLLSYAKVGDKEIQDIVKPAIASVVVVMLLIIACLLLDILAIILFLRDALKPGPFLIMNTAQTGFWGAVLIMNFVSVGMNGGAATLGFSIFIFLCFLGLFIYAVVGYRRAKKAAQRGTYAPAHNPAAPAGYPPQYQPNTAYQSRADVPVELQSQYVPPYQNGATPDYYQQTQPVKPAHMV